VGGIVKGVTPLPDGDLDGDGVPDIVVLDQPAWETVASPPSLRALSGRTGKQLWSFPVNTQWGERVNFVNNRPLYLHCHRFSAEEPPDVLFGYMISTWASVNSLRMVRISGRSGRAIWNEAIDEPCVQEFGPSSWELQPTLADLDGDGVLDLVLWVPVTGEVANAGRFARGCQLRAFSGKDGQLLWKGPSFGGSPGAPNPAFGLPAPVVLSNEGVPHVAVTTYSQEENAPGVQGAFCEVVIVNGKDGKVEWRWRGEDAAVVSGSGWYDGAPKRVHLATGPALCVTIHDEKRRWGLRDPKTGQPIQASADQLVLLDAARHQELQRRDVRSRVRFWVHDLDGDGQEEVLFFENGTLYALRDGLKDGWSWKLPGLDSSLLRIEPARQGQPATVVVASGGSVHGLDGSTGRPRWRCEGKEPAVGLLPTNNPQDLPHVLFGGLPDTSASTVICRRALAVGPGGKYVLPEPSERPGDHPLPEDPRLVRPLPWRPLATLPNNYTIMRVGGGLALLFAALILPVGLFRWAWRRRSGRLALLPLLWLGVLCLWAYLAYGTAALFLGWFYLVSAVVFAGPWLVFLGLVARSVLRQRWRSAGLLLGGAVLATLIIAGVWLALDARRMDPAEHYSWGGWYAVSLVGAHVWGVLLLIGWCGWGLFRFGRRLVSRLKQRVQTA
jgi:outer membrane protein assembly factor BamB